MYALGGILIGIAVSFGRRDAADKCIALAIAAVGMIVLLEAK